MIKIICILGESASGKSTIEKELVKLGYKKLITYTTRAIRTNEINGVDYHFITDEQFQEYKSNGFFVESATYNGWSYGIAKEDCTDDKVCVLTPHGFRQVKKFKDLNIISFYIKVGRRERLIKILERGDDIEEAYRRSLSDVGMFDGIEDEVDFVIDNNKYEVNPKEIADNILNYLCYVHMYKEELI